MPRQHTMLRLLLLHATAAAFPMLGAEIPLGDRTKMSWDPPPNGDDGVDHFQLFLPRRWSKDQRWPMLIFLHGSGDGVWFSAYIKLSRRVSATAESWPPRGGVVSLHSMQPARPTHWLIAHRSGM